MYVDLNPIRAGEARTPEASSHCSVSLRIQARAEGRARKPLARRVDRWLAPLTLAPDQLGDAPSQGGFRASDKGLLPISLEDYLRLLDWVGRQQRGDKRGAIPAELAPILDRLNVAQEELVDTVRDFPRLFPRFAGRAGQFKARAQQAGRRWLHGVRYAERVFG